MVRRLGRHPALRPEQAATDRTIRRAAWRFHDAISLLREAAVYTHSALLAREIDNSIGPMEEALAELKRLERHEPLTEKEGEDA